MRDFILLYINGNRYQIGDRRAFSLLSDLLRTTLGMTGTKVVCGEGACGACSVLVGRPDNKNPGSLCYQATNACLLRVFQLDRSHIVTVEGLTQENTTLSTVQQAIVEHHGTQCGYCTPGIVISLTALNGNRPTTESVTRKEAVRDALEGNLCRCTGYLPIQEAGLCLPEGNSDAIHQQYPAAPLLGDFERNAAESVSISHEYNLLHAHTLVDALSFLDRCSDTVVIAGGTGVLPVRDVGSDAIPLPTLSIGALRELAVIEPRDNGLFVGATATWTRLRHAAQTLFPELALLLRRFGSPQIRNQGTIGGSIAQKEMNSDWLPLLLVQDATVHLQSAQNGERSVPFAQFLWERVTGALLTGVTIPLPLPEERLRLYKVTRRQAFDRSVFCAAVSLRVAPDGTIVSSRIACGGVGPLPQRLPRTEQFLTGAPYTEETMRQAGAIAAAEISPVGDAYADAMYRRQLAARLLLRFYHDSDVSSGKDSSLA